MKKQFLKLAFFSFFCLQGTAFAGMSVCHDGSGTVTRVELRGNSIDGCNFYDSGQNISDAEYVSLRSLLKSVPRKYLKYENGNVLEMNTVEKAAVDILEGNAEQERQRQAHNAIVDQAKAEVDNPTTVASLLNTCISGITTAEIRAIKSNNPRPSATDEQLKTAVKQCLEGLKK